jgi:hypothetical protein
MPDGRSARKHPELCRGNLRCGGADIYWKNKEPGDDARSEVVTPAEGCTRGSTEREAHALGARMAENVAQFPGRF